MKNLLMISALSPENKAQQQVNSDAQKTLATLCNIKETKQRILLELFTPGFDRGDIQIHLDHMTLKVKGKKTEYNDSKFLRKGFTLNEFSNVFTLSKELNIDAIKVQLDQGVLLVEIPKIPAKSPKSILVN